MDLISNLVTYLTDKQTRFPKKVLFIFLIVIGFIAIDKVFSFSYFFNNSYKIQQVKEIKYVISDTTLTKNEVYQLKHLRNEIINHKSLFQKDYVSFFKFYFNDGRNAWWHYFTSAIIFLIIIIATIIEGFNRKNVPLDGTLIVYLIIVPLIFSMSWLFAKLLSIIPLLKYPWINYSINFIISLLIIIFIGKTRGKKN